MLDAVILDLGNVLAFHDNELLFLQLGEAVAFLFYQRGVVHRAGENSKMGSDRRMLSGQTKTVRAHQAGRAPFC